MSLKSQIITDGFKVRYMLAGLNSRKFLASSLTVGLMCVCWIASNWLSQAQSNFPALVTGMAAALSAYVAGNVLDGANDVKAAQNQNTDNTVVVNVPDPGKS